MNADFLLRHFDTLADTPDAVAKLRGLVLQLAVMGKLVPQDPRDEPASALLKKIAAEKARLVREGKIKRGETLPPVDPEDAPFELPRGWEWVRLDQISQYIQRGKGPKYVEESNIPVVSQKCIQWRGFDLTRARFIDESSLDGYAEERFLRPGDLLWNSTGTGTIGRINVLKDDVFSQFRRIVADSHVTVVRLINAYPEYVWIWIASPFIQSTIESDANGSTNQVELATQSVKNQVTPLPPLAEQHRIVARVDQLMALLDQLEQQREARRETRLRLNASALNELTTAPDATAFHHAWGRIRDHFHRLYDHPQTVAQLRQAILQLAVMGKLVPQDPHDEPASVLLKKIAAEKARLVREGKIKRGETLPPVDPEDAPFELPGGWEWVRLNALIELHRDINYGIILLGNEPPTDGIKTIRCSDVQYRRISLEKARTVSKDISDKYSKTILRGGEILMNIRGTLGGCGIVDQNMKGYNIAREVALIPISAHAVTRYVLDVISSPYIQINTLLNLRGIAYKGLNLEILRNFLIPLPPLAEQHRIVARVDQLMALCDQLEAQLSQSRDHGQRLLEAVVGRLTEAA
ncbi:MAG: restriction endonuclease subunit S [Magnetococcales bacterium]|nr:restriction endonuclease subunit S [Magnetococcales bacterium]